MAQAVLACMQQAWTWKPCLDALGHHTSYVYYGCTNGEPTSLAQKFTPALLMNESTKAAWSQLQYSFQLLR